MDIRDFILKIFMIVVKVMIKIRWCYFHIHPHYIKFKMGEDEYHFQNTKDGTIHSDYKLEDIEEY